MGCGASYEDTPTEEPEQTEDRILAKLSKDRNLSLLSVSEYQRGDPEEPEGPQRSRRRKSAEREGDKPPRRRKSAEREGDRDRDRDRDRDKGRGKGRDRERVRESKQSRGGGGVRKKLVTVSLMLSSSLPHSLSHFSLCVPSSL